MIVVIYTEDGFWLASDSYRSGGGKHISDVCKIHETRFGLLAKSGESQGVTESGEIYSTDKEVEELLVASENIESFQSKLRILFKQEIEQELAFLVDDPTVTSKNLERFNMYQPIPEPLVSMLTRTAIMFDTSTSDDVGKVLLVAPQSVPMTDPRIGTYYKYWAPSLFGWHPANDATEQTDPPIRFPPSVHEFTYLVSYAKTDAWVQKHPKQALTEILQQAHREKPESIGPPYAIVHVILRKSKSSKIKWVSKGVCPGWSESTRQENTLLQLRDELRQKSRANY
jgi:hypothetical protein